MGGAAWPIPISPSQANFDKHEAEKSRNWSEMMSATSAVRQVQGLTNAGLNPVLAATGGFPGGGAPGGAVASVSQGSGDPASAFQSNRETSANIGVLRAQEGKVVAEARGAAARSDVDEMRRDIYRGPDGKALLRGEIGRNVGGVIGGAAGYLSGAVSSAASAARDAGRKLFGPEGIGAPSPSSSAKSLSDPPSTFYGSEGF